ncbi:pikachurin-like [Limulus polyphemus]|uniref:Pikachurin-like n=1 Tax=Limulus polyphemus TaxID=6850 RepID=A0ABM1S018_LIMPO|nr:pikachurin-like [Limulus polyphemus]
MSATLRGDPPSAPDLKLVSVDYDAMKLDWETPQISLPVLQYNLEIKENGKRKQQLHLPGTINNYQVMHLKAGSKYEVSLAAYNVFGKGRASKPIVAFTESNGKEEWVTKCVESNGWKNGSPGVLKVMVGRMGHQVC